VPELPPTRFPNWYPDPTGRRAQRYFDGGRWTEHVFGDGRQDIDPLPDDGPAAGSSVGAPPLASRPARVVPLDDDPGAGHLRTARVVLVGVGAGYADQEVHDQRDRRIGTVRVIQPWSARVGRMLVSGEPESSLRVQVRDADEQLVVELVRPIHHLRVRMQVLDGSGQALGTIVQHQVLTRIRYSLEVGDVPIGRIDADRWEHGSIEITDLHGKDLARITRTWEVLAGSRFTPANSYVVQLAPGLPDHIRGLVLGCTLSVDTALRPVFD
jgi:uncharacterized protein YxjI